MSVFFPAKLELRVLVVVEEYLADQMPHILELQAAETFRTVTEEMLSFLQPSTDHTEFQPSLTHQPPSGGHNVARTLSKFHSHWTGTALAFEFSIGIPEGYDRRKSCKVYLSVNPIQPDPNGEPDDISSDDGSSDHDRGGPGGIPSG